VAAAASATAAAAAAGPPAAGVLLPGRSLGGIELGMTKPRVERLWGRAYGVCRTCARETWYFNHYAFRPEGAGVEWRRGRVAAVFTLNRPRAWGTRGGIQLGDPISRVTDDYGPILRRECGGYGAYELAGRRATTVFYELDDRLWAFALVRPGAPVCR
jgi:hypothetical protein